MITLLRYESGADLVSIPKTGATDQAVQSFGVRLSDMAATLDEYVAPRAELFVAFAF